MTLPFALTFTALHAYFSPSRYASSVITKAEAWQAMCVSFSYKSDSKSVHSLLHCDAGFSSSSFTSSNFLYCFFPGSRLWFLRLPKISLFCLPANALGSRARGYLFDLRQTACPEEYHSSFCSSFSHTEFLATATNLSWSTAIGPGKVAYPMLKRLPRSDLDFLLHIFNLSWSLHSFPSIWNTSSIILIHKMGKPLDSPDFFQLISLTSCEPKLFECIILLCLFFSLKCNFILSPRQAGFRSERFIFD